MEQDIKDILNDGLWSMIFITETTITISYNCIGFGS